VDKIDTIQKLVMVLNFLVPGFIWYSVYSQFVSRREKPFADNAILFVFLSCVNFALWIGPLYFLAIDDIISGHPIKTCFLWFVVLFLSPVVLGLLSGYGSSKDLYFRFLRWCGLNPKHPTPTSWDYLFSDSESKWLIVTFKDGSNVAGYWGENSFASSNPLERDVYLETVWSADGKGKWKETQPNNGILIRADEIRAIEVWNNQETTNGKTKQKTVKHQRRLQGRKRTTRT